MAQIAVLGYGTVGSGVVEALSTNSDIIRRQSGEKIQVKYVLDIRDFPEDPIQSLIVHDINVILNDDSVKLVVEVMGGVEPAFTFTKNCLMKGKSVVTSNKELVARHGAALVALAKEYGANYLFEASVGGGIPLIRTIRCGLAAEDFVQLTGILNGTTNFILTKMKKDGMDFKEALKIAQDKGYAEKKPDADVHGTDACRKIAILSSLICGEYVDSEEIYTEGITNISFMDFKYADKLGGAIKLIAKSAKTGEQYKASVYPAIVSYDNPLSNVDDVFNAILIKGNIVGDVMLYGSGAGKLPTASAIISDIIDCVKSNGAYISCLCSENKASLLDINDTYSDFLIRFKETNFESQLSDIDKHIKEFKVVKADEVSGEFGIVAASLKESRLTELHRIFGESFISAIRMEK